MLRVEVLAESHVARCQSTRKAVHTLETKKRRMVDHNQQQLTAREMVRAHAYPVLAAVSSLSLLSIAVLLIPQAVQTHRYNRCIDAQIAMRASINPKGGTNPGKMNYLKAVEHCEGL